MMTRRDTLDFEFYIADTLKNEKIFDAKDLEKISEQLHKCLEGAIRDYAYDCRIQDYT